jgi:hypothetical protein
VGSAEPVSRREWWGYGVWGFFGVVVGVPELWAALSEDTAWWPTISATVGELEYRWPAVALGVVALIAVSAYSALRLRPQRSGVLPPPGKTFHEAGFEGDPDAPLRTAGGQRLTRSKSPVREVAAGLYFAVATTIIAVSTAVASVSTDPQEEFATGRTMYGLAALLFIVVPAVLAWPKRFALDIPFPTLIETVRNLEQRLRAVAIVVAAGLAILLIHLVLYPWPAIVPDVQRLHETYECHPLDAAQHPLSDEQRERCRRIDEADVRPEPTGA